MKIYKRQPVLHVDNTNDLTFTGIYGLTLSHMVVGVLLRGASSPVTMYDSSSCPVIQSGFFLWIIWFLKLNEKGGLESVLKIMQQTVLIFLTALAAVQCNVIKWHAALAGRSFFTRCYDSFENLPAVYNVQ